MSFFLPFFPLERRHIRQLFELRLAERGAELAAGGAGPLAWDADVVDFLVDKASDGGGAWLPGCYLGALATAGAPGLTPNGVPLAAFL